MARHLGIRNARLRELLRWLESHNYVEKLKFDLWDAKLRIVTPYSKKPVAIRNLNTDDFYDEDGYL